MRFAKRVFNAAGIYGLIALAPMYFMEAKIGRDMPPAVTHPEFFYGFVGVGLAFQALFLIIAADPVRLRPAMLPSVLEKFSFGIAALALHFLGRLPPALLGSAGIDLAFGVLFLRAYFRTPNV